MSSPPLIFRCSSPYCTITKKFIIKWIKAQIAVTVEHFIFFFRFFMALLARLLLLMCLLLLLLGCVVSVVIVASGFYDHFPSQLAGWLAAAAQLPAKRTNCFSKRNHFPFLFLWLYPSKSVEHFRVFGCWLLGVGCWLSVRFCIRELKFLSPGSNI